MARCFMSLLVMGLSVLSGFAVRPSIVHEFAHLGDGSGVRTIFLLSNHESEQAEAVLRLFKPDGSELTLEINGQHSSTFQVKVPAQGMVRLVTSGTSDPLQSGWARLVSTHPIGAQVLFEIRQGDQLVTQAAVEPSGAIRSSSIFVDQGPGSATGVAFANVVSAGPIRVRLVLKNESGQTLGKEEVTLQAGEQLARFIHEFFPEVGSVRGTLYVQASGRFVVVALQQTGLVLGTLPPVVH